MKRDLNKKQLIAILVVVAAGLALVWLILGTSPRQPAGDGAESGHAETAAPAAPDAPRKGPHGGKLFVQDGYGLEVTIFEEEVPPEFRIYTYRDGKPLDPAASHVTLTLERLGRPPQVFDFTRERDYLRGDAVVEEPHSFKVTLTARHENRSYRFDYEQIEARVTMPEAQLARNGIEVLTAGPARIKSALQLLGEIRFNADRTVHIVPRVAGVVEAVPVDLGDRVRKGQLLAVIASQTVAEQRSELLAARQRVALARTIFEREKQLWEDKISAEQDYLRARNTLQEAEIALRGAEQKLASLDAEATTDDDLTRYEIRAPIDGIVIEKDLARGEAVAADAKLFVVTDLSTVWAEMTVYAKDLNTVKVGQRATVKAAAFESESTGTVSYVGALVGAETRTATARIVLPNPQGMWRPGLPVNIELVADEVEVPVAVSAEAIQAVRDWTVVFGRYGDVFEARPVALGRGDGRLVEVLGGLNAGERYAAKNSFLIKAELGKSGASHDH